MTEDPSKQKLHRLAQKLYESKAENIFAIDLRGVTVLTDFLLVATGNVSRHVLALAREMDALMNEMECTIFHREGGQEGDWVVLDYGFVMVHLFTPELREKYRIEQLWQEGKIVDLDLQAPKTLRGDSQ